MLNTTEHLTDSMALEGRYTSGATTKRPLNIVSGEGARVFDDQGRSYIDCVVGYGAGNLGHAHPAIVEAVQRQAAEIIVCPDSLYNPTRAKYISALCEATGMARVFMCNSGTEAIEGALKFARLLTGRKGIIATMRSFHGRSMGALSATWNKHYREPFEPLVPEVHHVPYNNLEKLEALMSSQIAAVLLEPVQGEGGVYPADDGYLRAVRALCDQHGTLLIIDEVQTGFGRTGWLLAHEHDGVKADMVCLSKSIAGGVPAGAILLAEKLGPIPSGMHGSTFGGNPLACAAGLATLDVLLNTALMPRAAILGNAVMEHLRANLDDEIVREVRGRGFMIGIEMRGKSAPVIAKMQEQGVLALATGATVLRLLPPLVISDADLWFAVNTAVEAVNTYAPE